MDKATAGENLETLAVKEQENRTNIIALKVRIRKDVINSFAATATKLGSVESKIESTVQEMWIFFAPIYIRDCLKSIEKQSIFFLFWVQYI